MANDEGKRGMATGRPVGLLTQWLLDQAAVARESPASQAANGEGKRLLSRFADSQCAWRTASPLTASKASHMPRADFYLIAKPRFLEEPLLLVCELARKAYDANCGR